MSSALLCWYKLKDICSWQILLPVETQGQFRDLDFILFIFFVIYFFLPVTAVFRREKKKRLCDASIWATRQAKTRLTCVFVCPWRFCPHAFKVEQNKPTVPTFWSAYVKPGLQALSHSFISECLHTWKKVSVRSFDPKTSPPTCRHQHQHTRLSPRQSACCLFVFMGQRWIHPQHFLHRHKNVIRCKQCWAAITESGCFTRHEATERPLNL